MNTRRLIEELRRISTTNSISLNKRITCKNAADELEKVPRWIPVTDRLPKIVDRYLATWIDSDGRRNWGVLIFGVKDNKDGESEIGFFTEHSEEGVQFYPVTHWMKPVAVRECSTGLCNTGDENTGDYNTGDGNTGDYNTGCDNAGCGNTGNKNVGHWNTGDKNTGYKNTGDYNVGDRNTGACNTGNCNTGDLNADDWNTGGRNTGCQNSGCCNAGSYNTGDCNTGYCNTGDFNTTDNATGCFCTEKQTIMFFDKPSTWTLEAWRCSDAYHALRSNIDLTKWVSYEDMMDAEKAEHPESEATGGYLKKLDFKLACREGWAKMTDEEKQAVKNLPNFDAEKFEQITGIDVNE